MIKANKASHVSTHRVLVRFSVEMIIKILKWARLELCSSQLFKAFKLSSRSKEIFLNQILFEQCMLDIIGPSKMTLRFFPQDDVSAYKPCNIHLIISNKHVLARWHFGWQLSGIAEPLSIQHMRVWNHLQRSGYKKKLETAEQIANSFYMTPSFLTQEGRNWKQIHTYRRRQINKMRFNGVISLLKLLMKNTMKTVKLLSFSVRMSSVMSHARKYYHCYLKTFTYSKLMSFGCNRF